mgnify:CR=1 FL=1
MHAGTHEGKRGSNWAVASADERRELRVADDATTTRGQGKVLATDWSFDYAANLLDTQWHEPKTVESYAMPRVPDSRWWFDIYCISELLMTPSDKGTVLSSKRYLPQPNNDMFKVRMEC